MNSRASAAMPDSCHKAATIEASILTEDTNVNQHREEIWRGALETVLKAIQQGWNTPWRGLSAAA